jgi:hypothetical protein
VNSKNILESCEKQIARFEERETRYEDSIMSLHDEALDLMYFNLENNDDALSFFEDQGFNTSELIPFIKDKIYELNEYNGDDHPIVPYASMTESKILINQIRLLNHKWILTDFSDGKYWGELFITYEINESGKLNFNLVEHFLYPIQNY